MQTGAEQVRRAYPTPDELWNRVFAEQNVWRDRFAAVPFEDKGGYFEARYYQDIAIERVLEAIAAGQDRILLTLATGTGKTFIAFQIAWKLFQSRWNLQTGSGRRADAPAAHPVPGRPQHPGRPGLQRVLRLSGGCAGAHRTRRHPQEGPRAEERQHLLHDLPDLHERAAMPTASRRRSFGDYPPDFFDFIVIDECHRGGANDESNWRGILEYFAPAVQLGLTATPKRTDNVDTYAYFGEPVYIYSLKEGINDGFLTPFKVKQIATTLDEYVYTADDEVVEGEVEAGQALHRRRLQPDHRDQGARSVPREAVHGA